MVTKFDDMVFFNKTYLFQLEWCRIELKQHDQKIQKEKEDTINGYLYVENIIKLKIIYGM